MVKKGFSLIEALVVMAIISIFFAVASRVVTTKAKPEKASVVHGYYECYKKGSELYQRYVRENLSVVETEMGTICKFDPPNNVTFYNIISYVSNCYYTDTQPLINNVLYIKPSTSTVSISSTSGTIELADLPDDKKSTKSEIGQLLDMYPESNISKHGYPGVLISW